jgi:hypothetical protein
MDQLVNVLTARRHQLTHLGNWTEAELATAEEAIMSDRSKAEIQRIRDSAHEDWKAEESSVTYPWQGSYNGAIRRFDVLEACLVLSPEESRELDAIDRYINGPLPEYPDTGTQTGRLQSGQPNTSNSPRPLYPDEAQEPLDPDLTYDESTNPSNGWRDPETGEPLAASGTDYGDWRRSKWTTDKQVDRELQRRGERYASPDTRADIADQYLTDLQAPRLELNLTELEAQPSGSAAALPYPTIRISTVSGALYLNSALIHELRHRRDDHRLPSHALVSLTKDRSTLVLQFLDTYAAGAHVLGLSTKYNRGYSISCGSTIAKLIQHLAKRWTGEIPAYHDYSHRSMGDQYNWAADQLYGRRRAHMVNSRLDLWAVKLADPLV